MPRPGHMFALRDTKMMRVTRSKRVKEEEKFTEGGGSTGYCSCFCYYLYLEFLYF